MGEGEPKTSRMKKTKVIFLDRDGVINRGRGNDYVDSWKKFHFIPGSLKALRLLNEQGYRVIVISNQAGVAKGVYSLRDLSLLTRRMREKVEAAGGRLDAVYYCPHQKENQCACRKPKTALFRRAQRRFGIPFKKTFVVGDSVRDILAGKRLRCRTILVLSGREKLSRKTEWKVQPDVVKRDLLKAVEWILRNELHRS